MGASRDSHTNSPHLHVDHVFAATVRDSEPVGTPEHTVRWFSRQEIAEVLGISTDSRLQGPSHAARQVLSLPLTSCNL
jgi:hypothetical protein